MKLLDWISPARVAQALELRRAGHAWTLIAHTLGTTPHTVRLYASRHPDATPAMLRPIYRMSDRVTQIGRMRDAGVSRADIREQLGLTIREVKHALSTWRHRQRRAGKPKGLPGRRAWVPTSAVQEALRLRQDGATWRTIGRALGYDSKTVRRAVAAALGADHRLMVPVRNCVRRGGKPPLSANVRQMIV